MAGGLRRLWFPRGRRVALRLSAARARAGRPQLRRCRRLGDVLHRPCRGPAGGWCRDPLGSRFEAAAGLLRLFRGGRRRFSPAGSRPSRCGGGRRVLPGSRRVGDGYEPLVRRMREGAAETLPGPRHGGFQFERAGGRVRPHLGLRAASSARLPRSAGPRVRRGAAAVGNSAGVGAAGLAAHPDGPTNQPLTPTLDVVMSFGKVLSRS